MRALLSLENKSRATGECVGVRLGVVMFGKYE